MRSLVTAFLILSCTPVVSLAQGQFTTFQSGDTCGVDVYKMDPYRHEIIIDAWQGKIGFGAISLFGGQINYEGTIAPRIRLNTWVYSPIIDFFGIETEPFAHEIDTRVGLEFNLKSKFTLKKATVAGYERLSRSTTKVYQVSGKYPAIKKFGLRSGIGFHQYAPGNGFDMRYKIGRRNQEDRLYRVQTANVYVGLVTRTTFRNHLDCPYPMNVRQWKYRQVFFDLNVAPFINLGGRGLLENGLNNFDEEVEFSYLPVGFRLGLRRFKSSPFGRLNTIISLEVGMDPGVYEDNPRLYAMAGLGFGILPVRNKVMKSGLIPKTSDQE